MDIGDFGLYLAITPRLCRLQRPRDPKPPHQRTQSSAQRQNTRRMPLRAPRFPPRGRLWRQGACLPRQGLIRPSETPLRPRQAPSQPRARPLFCDLQPPQPKARKPPGRLAPTPFQAPYTTAPRTPKGPRRRESRVYAMGITLAYLASPAVAWAMASSMAAAMATNSPSASTSSVPFWATISWQNSSSSSVSASPS